MTSILMQKRHDGDDDEETQSPLQKPEDEREGQRAGDYTNPSGLEDIPGESEGADPSLL